MNLLPKDLQDIIYNYKTQLNYNDLLIEFKKNIKYKMIAVTNCSTDEVTYNSHLIIKKKTIIKYSPIEQNKKILRIITIKTENNKTMDWGRFIRY